MSGMLLLRCAAHGRVAWQSSLLRRRSRFDARASTIVGSGTSSSYCTWFPYRLPFCNPIPTVRIIILAPNKYVLRQLTPVFLNADIMTSVLRAPYEDTLTTRPSYS
jgi:hypothetical protein